MTKSQNTKNEQQKDLCITSEQLTEQWKKGELKFGAYYVNRLEEHRIWLYNDRSKTPEFQHEIYEILAPVPSYEEWQKVLNIDFNNEVLRLENAKLKELLKECLAHLTIGKYDIIVTPINILCDEVEEVLK